MDPWSNTNFTRDPETDPALKRIRTAAEKITEDLAAKAKEEQDRIQDAQRRANEWAANQQKTRVADRDKELKEKADERQAKAEADLRQRHHANYMATPAATEKDFEKWWLDNRLDLLAEEGKRQLAEAGRGQRLLYVDY